MTPINKGHDMVRMRWGQQDPLAGRTAAWLLLSVVACSVWPDSGQARREPLTTEQKQRLRSASRVRLDAVVLTAQGRIAPDHVADVITTRLRELGYTVQPNPGASHDVTVKVRCEEQKVWEGTGRSGGDADMPGSASRLWKGPACQFAYRLNGKSLGWRHEVRTDFEDTRAAARAAHAHDTSTYAISQLGARLREDPFPYLLAAEWGQSERLLPVLDAPKTTSGQKVTVIALLGNMFAVDALPRLSQALKDPDPAVAQASAVAIGTIGHQDGIPVLLDVLAHGKPELHLAAVKGLGQLAPLHPQADIVPALLDVLPHEPIPVQTEIVRALGKTQDRRIQEPLRELARSVQARSRADSSPELRELQTTLGVALDQFHGAHSNE